MVLFTVTTLRTSNLTKGYPVLKMEALYSSEMFIATYQTARCHNAEGHSMNLPRCKNLRLLILSVVSFSRTCSTLFCPFPDKEPVVLNVFTAQHAVTPERTQIPEKFLLNILRHSLKDFFLM
jgi:hypothetical protein